MIVKTNHLESHTIQEYLTNHLDVYLNLHQEMVAINSYTENPEGVNKLGRYTAKIFSFIGFKSEFLQSKNNRYGKHLFLVRKPELSNNDIATKSIALISHLDTVFSAQEEVRNNFYWQRVGNKIYGPGVVDIKGGTVLIYMMLDAIQRLFPKIYNQVEWIICLNASEERLSDDFAGLCKQRIPPEIAACLIFESGYINGDEFRLVTARKGRVSFKINVEGKSAHAGNNHDKGLNAIIQLAAIIQKIAALTDYSQQLTFNVARISGGTELNRVPNYAEAFGEMRAFSPEVFEDGVKNLKALANHSEITSSDGYSCNIDVELCTRTNPWPTNQQTEQLFIHWQKNANLLGMKLTREQRGGLSDGNYLWMDYPTLDGLGPAGNHAHCSERDVQKGKEQEFVLISSMVPKTLLNIMAILSLLGFKIDF